MLNHSEIYAGMSRRDNYARCRSSTQSIDKIGVRGFLALSIVRQNVVQEVERMRTELTKRQSVLETSIEFRDPPPRSQPLTLKYLQRLEVSTTHPRWQCRSP